MKIVPKINQKYKKGQFPRYPANKPKNWGFFTEEEIKDAIQENIPRLLMLDLDLPFARDCSLRCPTCFRRNNAVDDASTGDISYEKLIEVIDESRELGLKTVKICGPGEPTENSDFFRFLRDVNERDIGVAVFTKGQMGSDELARKYHSAEGVYTAEDFYKKCFEEHNIDFLICVSSFDEKLQNRLVGNPNQEKLGGSYTRIRNSSLEILAETGYTSTNPTRAVVVNAPVTKDTIVEAFYVHKWATERGFYSVTAMSMVSGKQFTPKFIKKVDPDFKQKIRLYEDIYNWQISQGIINLDDLHDDGISCMPGTHPCNQIASGLYVTADGNVVRCPGYNEPIGNVKNESIRTIWERSAKEYAGCFNCGCPPKSETTIPTNLYEVVLKNLRSKHR